MTPTFEALTCVNVTSRSHRRERHSPLTRGASPGELLSSLAKLTLAVLRAYRRPQRHDDLGRARTVSDQAWTIESICEALGNPVLSQRFLGEINRAPAHELLTVFAKWQSIAAGMAAAAERGRSLAEAEKATGEIPGEWADRTERVQAEAAAARARGAA